MFLCFQFKKLLLQMLLLLFSPEYVMDDKPSITTKSQFQPSICPLWTGNDSCSCIPVCTAERRVLTFSTKPSIQDNFESLLQSATTCNYKVRQFIFLQSARTCYYKVRQLFCYKLRQVLLQRATGITKCDNFITKCDRYYKVRRL